MQFGFPRAIRLRIASLLLFASASWTAPAQTLDFAQSLLLAEQRSRLLPAQDSAELAARQMAVSAGQLPDPVLKAGINNLPVEGSDRFSVSRDFMTMRSIGLMQEFTRAEKRQARSARFEREAEATSAERLLILANLQRDTALAWLDRYYETRARTLLQLQRNEAELQIQSAEAAYKSGRGTQADVFSARAAQVQIDDRLAQAERQISVATIRLSRWVGAAAQAPLGEPPAMEGVPISPENLDTAVNHHPEIAVLARQEQVARAEADIARSNRQSDASAEVMYSQRGSAYTNMISFNIAIPLQWDRANRQDRELAARLAMADRLREQKEEALRARVAEVRAMRAEWESYRDRLKRYDTLLIPLAQQRNEAALTAYHGASMPLMTVLEARRVSVEVQLERVRLEQETARLWAQLTFLVPAGHVGGNRE